MKSTFLPSVLVAGCLTFNLCAEEPKKAETKSPTVRVAFVPGSKPKKGEEGGASVTALFKGGPAGPGNYFLQANAGVGDSFPVREEGGPTLFEVFVIKGDDDHLEMETRCKDVIVKFELKRDKPVETEAAGKKYSFLFPNVFVNREGNDHPTETQAMILISRKGTD